MQENGSPPPEFETDEDHSYFLVRLPSHPQAHAGGTKVGVSTMSTDAGTKSALSRHQVEILQKCLVESEITELMTIAGRADRTKFRTQVLNPMLLDELLEMTVPEKPTSRNQRYRTTEHGKAVLAAILKAGE